MKNERISLLQTARQFARDWKKYREYIFYATRAELLAETSNAYLDWIWWVLEPFCLMIVYTIVFGVIFHSHEPYFPLFVFSGITMWRFFAMTVQGSANLIRANKMIISRVYIPKQILLLVLMFRNGFKSLLSLFIVFIMMLFYHISFSLTWLLVIPAVILLFSVTYFVSCAVMHVGVFIDDMSYIVNIVVTMLMYFTGTFWSIENRLPAPYGQIVCRMNPIAYCISLARNGLLYATSSFHWTWFAWLAAALLLSLAGTRMIYRSENTYVKML